MGVTLGTRTKIFPPSRLPWQRKSGASNQYYFGKICNPAAALQWHCRNLQESSLFVLMTLSVHFE